MTTIDKIRWCCLQHEQTNHRYGDMSYTHHLDSVFKVANMFSSLSPLDWDKTSLAAYGHDLIEDTRNTYNDVKAVLGEEVADIIYALTNEKGKNRAERANDKYYALIRATKGAVFIKLCDRIANIEYAVKTDSKMLKMYEKENESFLKNLFPPVPHYKPMIDYIDTLFKAGKI